MIKPLWKTTPSSGELRSFSLVIALIASGGLILFGFVFPNLLWSALLGTLLFLVLIGQWFRSILVFTYRLWMSAGLLVGAVMSRLILALIFYFIFFPLGFLLKLTGRQPLTLKKETQKDTYWLKRSHSQSDLSKMH